MSFGERFGALVKERRELQGLSATELAKAVFEDASKRSRISELENGKVKNPHATTIAPLAGYLGISEEELKACRNPPANDHGQGHLPDENVSLAQDMRQMSRAQLESLGRRFGIDEAETLSDANLVALLESKAEDLKRLSDEIEALRGLSDRIDNIIAAARAAAESRDLEEAEHLVASAKESLSEQMIEPLERNWRLATTQADIALVRGDTQQAYDLISDAADAFAAVDPVEPARRRIYDARLEEHALRYGGDGFLLTMAMIREALDHISEEDQPNLFGHAQNNLGNALSQQGERTGGAEGAKLQAEAVAAYRAALRVRTEAGHSVDWAKTQNNVGNALARQGEHTGGEEGAKLLAEAVIAFCDSLRVRNEANHPVQAALVHANNALRVYDPEHMPYDYGTATRLRDRIAAKLDALEG